MRPVPVSVVLFVAFVAASCTSGSAGETQGLATSTTSTATVAAGPTTEVAESGSELAKAVERIVAGRDGGAAVLSVRDDEVVSFATGPANSNGDPILPGQPFRVGSISKPFVAVMILQMVDEGIVDLEATLSTYLPDTPVGADATIRQLLGHDSGIPNYTDQIEFMTKVVNDPSGGVPLRDTLAVVEDLPLGTVGQFSYSNTNYILLGQLIEAVEQRSLNQALSARISDPLGLEDTYFADIITPARGDIALGWSEGFSAGDIPVSYRSVATTAWAAGSLVSTTDDLLAFLTALLQEDLISIGSLGQMTFTGTDGYGLGLFQAGLGEGSLGYGHSGGIFGYTSTMAMDPISGDAIVVLTNNDQIVADLIAAEVILTVWTDS